MAKQAKVSTKPFSPGQGVTVQFTYPLNIDGVIITRKMIEIMRCMAGDHESLDDLNVAMLTMVAFDLDSHGVDISVFETYAFIYRFLTELNRAFDGNIIKETVGEVDITEA